MNWKNLLKNKFKEIQFVKEKKKISIKYIYLVYRVNARENARENAHENGHVNVHVNENDYYVLPIKVNYQ